MIKYTITKEENGRFTIQSDHGDFAIAANEEEAISILQQKKLTRQEICLIRCPLTDCMGDKEYLYKCCNCPFGILLLDER